MNKFNIGQTVLFFTRENLKIKEGTVVGIFVEPQEDIKAPRSYVYQVEYILEKEEDGKKVSEKMLAIPDVENIRDLSQKDELKKVFKPFFKKSIHDNIKTLKEDLKEVTEKTKVAEIFKKDIKEKLEELIEMKKDL